VSRSGSTTGATRVLMDVHDCLHSDVRSLADVRHPRRADPEGVEAQRPELAWLSAVAVLNGSLWRLPAGMLTDRIGGRKVTIAMLLLTAIPCFFLTQAGQGYGALLVLAFLVGFAGNLFSVGIAWNSAWTPKEHQGFALGVFGAGNVGASVTKLLLVLFPAIIAGTAGHVYFGVFKGGWRIFPASMPSP
jgi:NNP family nitrate/nitrite transporter-like MFS transporter